MRFYPYFSIPGTAIIVAVALYLFFSMNHTKNPGKAYWLWAGITENLAPKNSNLYIYQGFIQNDRNLTNYQHRGLYAYPISCNKCYLVYRIDPSLPDAKQVVTVFLNDAKKWEKHQVAIRGLQIDYDSPTKQLALYSRFLSELRKYLPFKYELDITGLGDWITAGNIRSLKAIAASTEDIVFQLYDGRHPLNHASYYIQALKRYPFPFRLGVLQTHPLSHELRQLKNNPNFQGVIYFIQKG